jgi:hypothetical protein
MPFDMEAFRFLAFKMTEEAGVQLLLHSMVVDVIVRGSKM